MSERFEAAVEAGITYNYVRTSSDRMSVESGSVVPEAMLDGRAALGFRRWFEVSGGVGIGYASPSRPIQAGVSPEEAPSSSVLRWGIEMRGMFSGRPRLTPGWIVSFEGGTIDYHERVFRLEPSGSEILLSESDRSDEYTAAGIGALLAWEARPRLELALGVLLRGYSPLATRETLPECTGTPEEHACGPSQQDDPFFTHAAVPLFLWLSYDAEPVTLTLHSYANAFGDPEVQYSGTMGAGFSVRFRFEIPERPARPVEPQKWSEP